MWNQWQAASAAASVPLSAPPPTPSVPPPLPDAPPPPPPSDQGGSGSLAPSVSATVAAPTATAGGVSIAVNPYSSTGPATMGGAGNPYEQYTAAQYAAMTPEQQYALQHHWHQWQTYQQEYAKWHAQYGEQVSTRRFYLTVSISYRFRSFLQYKREMAAAAAANSGGGSVTVAPSPVAAPTPAPAPVVAPAPAPTPIAPGPQAYPPGQNYYPTVASSSAPMTAGPPPTLVVPGIAGKIMAQPQLYNQPPPPPPQKSGGYNQQNMWQGPPPSMQQQQAPNRYGNQINYNNQGMDNQSFPNLHQPPPNLQRPPPQNQNPIQPQQDNQWGSSRPPWQQAPIDNSGQGRWEGPPPQNDITNRWSGPPPGIGNNSNETNRIRWEPPGPHSTQVTNADQNRWMSGPPPDDQNQNRRWDGPPPSINDSQQNQNNRQNSNRWSGNSSDEVGNQRTGWGGDNSQDSDGLSHNPNQGKIQQSTFTKNSSTDLSGSTDNFGKRSANIQSNHGNNFNQNQNHGENFGGGGAKQGGPGNFVGRGGGGAGPDNFGNNNFNQNNRRQNNRWGDNHLGGNRDPNQNKNFNNLGYYGGDSDGPGSFNNSIRGNFNHRNFTNQQNQQNSSYNQNQLWNQNQHPNRQQQQPDLDEASFDRLFNQWEKQFEDWKKANANHPDREEYHRYEEEFEKQRRRIAERREQMRRRRQQAGGSGGGMGQGPGPGSGPDSLSSFGGGYQEGSRNDAEKQSSEERAPDEFRPVTGNYNEQSKGGSLNLNSQNRTEAFANKSREYDTRNDGSTDESCLGPSNSEPNCNPRPESSQENINTSNSEDENENTSPLDPISQKTNPKTPSSASSAVAAGKPRVTGKRRQPGGDPTLSTPAKQVREEAILTISLDDDDDEEEVECHTSQAASTPMGNIFNKSDGIPGLDLVEDGGSKNPPLLFGGVGQPESSDASKPSDPSACKNQNNESLSDALKDPDFINNLTQAVANVQEREQQQQQKPKEQKSDDGDQFAGTDGRPLSFAEWQRKKNNGQDSKSRDSFDSSSPVGQNQTSDVGKDSGKSPGPTAVPGGGPGPAQKSGLRYSPNIADPQVAGNNFMNFDNNDSGSRPSGGSAPVPGLEFCPRNFGPNNQGPFGPGGPGGPHFGPNFGPGGQGPNFGPSGPGFGFGPRSGPNFRHAGPPSFGFGFGPGPGPGPGPRGFGPRGGAFGPRRGDDFGGPSFGGPNFGPGNGPGGPRGFNGPNFGSGPNSDNNPFRRQSGPSMPNFDDDGGGGGVGGGTQRGQRNFQNRSYGGGNNRKNWNDGYVQVPFPDEPVYRPMKVFDYSNSPSAAKVIDYGHLSAGGSGSGGRSSMGAGIPDFRPVQTFEYGHASLPGPNRMPAGGGGEGGGRMQGLGGGQTPIGVGEGSGRGYGQGAVMPGKRKNKRKNKQQRQTGRLNVQENENQNTFSNDENGQKEVNAAHQDDSSQDHGSQSNDLEDISDGEDNLTTIDCDEVDSLPSPPSMQTWSDGSDLPGNLHVLPVSVKEPASYVRDKIFTPPPPPLSLFPSRATANQNLPQVVSAPHLEMSVPTNENCNTISVDEVLLPPGRLTRPKRICIILRGPPGCGKSHVARLIKDKELEMGGANPRILSIDDYFIIENDYEEKCPKTGKKIPKKEILYEYDDTMEDTYMQYLLKSFKKTLSDNLYDFIIVDCNNNSLRTLNEFYCHAKDSNFVPYVVDLHCDLETCLGRNSHQRTKNDIQVVLDNWCPTPLHYIKLDVSSLVENVVEMEDVENMATDDNANADDAAPSAAKGSEIANVEEEDDDNSADASNDCGFLKSKWECDTTEDNLGKLFGFSFGTFRRPLIISSPAARLDGTKRLMQNRKAASMADYLQLDEEWEPPRFTANGKKRVRWADIEEKRSQEKMRAIGFVVGQTDWNRMMDPHAGSRALNKTKYIERIKKRR
ncbi:hypothetical protein KR026_007828 [Drosophila bipectinata]|nr:hypothetical protein KR026_007828 [Drosophila bipectinata]